MKLTNEATARIISIFQDSCLYGMDASELFSELDFVEKTVDNGGTLLDLSDEYMKKFNEFKESIEAQQKEMMEDCSRCGCGLGDKEN